MRSTLVKFAASAGLAAVLFGGANFAYAASLTPAQVQAIISLLASFGADQSTITNVQAALTGASSLTGTTTPACITLSANLFPDVTDATSNGQVTKLQQFLALDSSIYPQGLVTGYFGPATLGAVQRWQSRHGIVSSGDPDSTGYGFVGPKTRLVMSCGQTSIQTTQVNQSMTTVVSTSTSPTTAATVATTTQSVAPTTPVTTTSSGGGGGGSSGQTTNQQTQNNQTQNNQSQNQSTSTPSSDTTPPSTPANLTVTGVTTSGVSLSWTASTDNVGVTGYNIYRNNSLVGQNISSATGSASTIFTNSGLAAGTAYTFGVSAVDAAGNTSSQATVSTTTTASAPPACSPIAPSPISGSWERQYGDTINWSLVIQSSGSYTIQNGQARETPSNATGDNPTIWAASTPVSYPVFNLSGSGRNFSIAASNLDPTKYYTLAVDLVDTSCGHVYSQVGELTFPNHPSSASSYPMFKSGDSITVANGPAYVNSTPSLFDTSSNSIGTQPNGTAGTVSSMQYYNNRYWYNVTFPSAPNGWVAETYLSH